MRAKFDMKKLKKPEIAETKVIKNVVVQQTN
jgi:hypothetical protein